MRYGFINDGNALWIFDESGRVKSCELRGTVFNSDTGVGIDSVTGSYECDLSCRRSSMQILYNNAVKILLENACNKIDALAKGVRR